MHPAEAIQFGQALWCILQRILHADPRHGPVYLLKVDLSDGYYQVHLRTNDIPQLAVALPPPLNDLVALPLCLPMGWINSPAYFCAVAETIADLTNHDLQTNPHPRPPPHRLEHHLTTAPCYRPSQSTPSHPVQRLPLRHIDVYVDDFLGAAQGSQQDL